MSDQPACQKGLFFAAGERAVLLREAVWLREGLPFVERSLVVLRLAIALEVPRLSLFDGQADECSPSVRNGCAWPIP